MHENLGAAAQTHPCWGRDDRDLAVFDETVSVLTSRNEILDVFPGGEVDCEQYQPEVSPGTEVWGVVADHYSLPAL